MWWNKQKIKIYVLVVVGIVVKKSGCDYFVSDFENMKLDYLETVLNTGRVSVVATCDFIRLPNGKLIN